MNRSARGLLTVDAAGYAKAREVSRAFSAELDRELAAALKDSGALGVQAVKTRLGMVRLRGGPRSRLTRRGALPRGSLRAKLTRNVRVQVGRTDVRIVQGAMGLRGAGAKGLPRRLDAAGPFRHPSFGRDPWVTQRAWDRYFTGTLLALKPEMTRRMEQVLADALERASHA